MGRVGIDPGMGIHVTLCRQTGGKDGMEDKEWDGRDGWMEGGGSQYMCMRLC